MTNVFGPELIYSRTDRSGECWLWLGGYLKDGYGQISIASKLWLAHRASFTIFRGPIPPTLQLDHLCRVRACVNPDHLEPVTNAENCRRGTGAKTHCVNGHEFTVENTYTDRKNGHRHCRECNRLWKADGRPRLKRRYPIGWRRVEVA
jgi:hypothetical protein